MMPLKPVWRAIDPVRAIRQRIQLSRAKHRSLAGHPRLARRLARLVPDYGYEFDEALAIDGAPAEIRRSRAAAIDRLATALQERAPRTLAASRALAVSVSDQQLVARHQVPFQFRASIGNRLEVGSIAESADGVRLRDLDGNESYDLGGSYGVNLFGNDVYRRCIAGAVTSAADLGLVLGAYHPVIADNVTRLRTISGMDEVSFHMSGTEAVMQAVRLARFNSGRSKVVRFAGAYHGWWDGVQAGPGNPLPPRDVYTLEDLSAAALRVIKSRDDIACVLVNPLQALTPNASPATDSTLVTGVRTARFDKARYARWLQALRRACDASGAALVFDEVFVGFRLAKGGAQEFFGVRADMVTYGKTLGGGLPVGVVCGRRHWMRRFREDHPADVSLARGTFSAHPYVMTAMNGLLNYLDTPEAEATWRELDARWDIRCARWNAALESAEVPIRMANLASVFTTTFTAAGRFHWLLQYYLRVEGLSLAWIGTGRFIFSHDYRDTDLDEVIRRFLRAARAMQDDGWFWRDDSATAASIQWSVLREMLRALIRPRRPRMASELAPQKSDSAVSAIR